MTKIINLANVPSEIGLWKKHKKPSIEFLRTLFTYSPESGELKWKSRPQDHFASHGAFLTWNTRFAGKTAGTKNKHKRRNAIYMSVSIGGYRAGVHTVVWALTQNAWPTKTIDHIDRDGLNNRISNLRELSIGEQQKNRGLQKSNTSTVKGVSRLKDKWRARIGANAEEVLLGVFNSFEEAVAVRVAAEVHYGYEPQEVTKQ